MTQRELKSQLVLKGITQKSIADEYGCTEQAICRWISGNFKSKPLELFVLKKLGLSA